MKVTSILLWRNYGEKIVLDSWIRVCDTLVVQGKRHRKRCDMREWMAEFDTFAGTGTAYYYANTKADALKQIREELAAWDGGHADVYNEDGTFVCYIEV